MTLQIMIDKTTVTSMDKIQSTCRRPTTANIKVIIMIMMMKLDP